MLGVQLVQVRLLCLLRLAKLVVASFWQNDGMSPLSSFFLMSISSPDKVGFGAGRPVAVMRGVTRGIAHWWSTFFRFGIARWCFCYFSLGPRPPGVPEGGSALSAASSVSPYPSLPLLLTDPRRRR